MLGYVLIGMLAAFGLLCAVWVMWGFLYNRGTEGILLYAGKDSLSAAQKYLWLREMGLAHCPLLVLEPEEDARQWLENRNIEICSREALALRLGIGAEEN